MKPYVKNDPQFESMMSLAITSKMIKFKFRGHQLRDFFRSSNICDRNVG